MFGLSNFVNEKTFALFLFVVCFVNGSEIDNEYLDALRAKTVTTRTFSKASTFNSSGSGKTLEIVCYEPSDRPDLCNLWRRTCFQVNSKAPYMLHFGENASVVYDQYKRLKFSLHNFLFAKSKSYCIHSYHECCLAVEANQPYSLKLDIKIFSLAMVSLTILGVIVFRWAQFISESPFSHYVIGTVSGMLFFTLIVAFFLTRLFTSKLPFILLALAGTGTLAYFTGWVYDKLDYILEYYSNFLLAYVALTSFISLMICYIRGPITNPRSLSVLRWMLKGLALLAVYTSISYEPYGLALCVLLAISSFY